MPLSITDTNMLQLPDILKGAGIIRFKEEFYRALGMLRQNVYEVRKGIRGFTPEQIRIACITYGIDANWIIGVTDKVFLKAKVKPKREHGLRLFE